MSVSLFDYAWYSAYTSWCDERIVIGLAMWIVHEIAFFASVAYYIIISRIPSLSIYKVQKTDRNTAGDMWKVARRLVVNHLLIILPMSLFYPYASGPFGPLPSWPRLVFNFAFSILVGDFLLYWVHRISHWPIFYRWHKLHHDFVEPFGLSSEYMDPLELVVVGAASTVGAMLCMSHPLEAMFLLAVRAFLDVDHHCGYSLPWSVQLLPGVVGAHFHDWHHEAFVGNYGVIFSMWDTLFDTVHPKYQERWESYCSPNKDKFENKRMQ